MKFLFITLFLFSYSFSNDLTINILYLEEIIKKPPVLSNIIEEAKDSGLKGAKLAIKDSNRSSIFIHQKYILETKVSKKQDVLIKKFENFVKKGSSYILVNVSYDLFLKLQKHKLSSKVLLINTSLNDNSLRLNICDKNILHTIASNAMLYDALAQFLVKRDWKKVLLIKGIKEEDKKIVKAIKKSFRKFQINIIDEKTWQSTSDIRRKAQKEMPTFTQSKEHDLVVVADFYGDFGEYIYFNTWLPRPLAGTQGLKAVTWHKVIEAWGAAQLQKRFEKFAKRWMNSKDYASYVAIQTIVRSIMHTKNLDLKTNLDFIYSSKFDLGAYKGRKLTFRNFNGQLRQPISLVHSKALVSTSPQVGFLHPFSDLDTLGINKHEMRCK